MKNSIAIIFLMLFISCQSEDINKIIMNNILNNEGSVRKEEDEELNELFQKASLWQVGTNIQVVQEAREKLINMADKSLNFLMTKLDTTNTLEMRAISAVLTGMKRTKVISALKQKLKDKNATIRNNVIELLAQLKVIEMRSEIEELLEDDQNYLYSIRALATLGDFHSAKKVEKFLFNKNERIRINSAYTLGQLKNPDTLDSLILLLSDKFATVRYPAQWAITNFGESAVEKLVEQVMKEKSAKVRAHLVMALRDVKSEKSYNALIKSLNDEDFTVRAYAAEAIGYLSNKDAINVLQDTLKDEKNDFVRMKTYDSLEKLKSLHQKK